MKNLKEVDWSKAPEGATHYNVSCASPWLKGTPVSYFNDVKKVWIEYKSDDSLWEDHFFNAVKRPQEWCGSGVPPIGTVCEYYWPDRGKWRKCEVVAYYFANVVAVDVFDSTAISLINSSFRPIKTPEHVAAEERLHAIGEMIKLVKNLHKYKDIMSVLYDAGYRKTEVKK